MACQFSPRSNNKSVTKADELRVLICTDVLSGGQNLQDCNTVVNFDLPWAIIRLIQRAGRVDRIGQKAEEIHCYSFLPADGVERLIQLRARIQQRLQENAEVVGTDEAFFEDEQAAVISDLYPERSGVLDGRASSPRRRTYERLKRYAMEQMNTLFRDEELERALDDIYLRPLLTTSADLLNRLMRGGVNDEELGAAEKSLREDGRLTFAEGDASLREPRVVCSMGLTAD